MKKQGTRRLIIFTDLDGTLLNHGDYSWEDARPALEKIREAGIPLVICTSKTRREVETIRIELGISSPFIAENGGGIFFPAGHEDLSRGQAVVMDDALCIPLGKPYGMIRAFMEQAGKDCGARGFGDMSVEEVSERTGLPLEKAALAKARDFTEPFVMERSDDLSPLEQEAGRRGLVITRGGRFYHCMGVGNDKGTAVRMLTEIFARNRQESVTTLGFGDSPNDFPLLKAVDKPVLIPHEDGSFEDLSLPGLVLARYPGSRGWNAAALAILAGGPEGLTGRSGKNRISERRHSHDR